MLKLNIQLGRASTTQMLCQRHAINQPLLVRPYVRASGVNQIRGVTTGAATTAPTPNASSSSSAAPGTPGPSSDLFSTLPTTTPAAATHFKITLRRSAISLGDRKKATLKTLGLHRRMQTVYHRHSPDIAGKILFVKELLEVENVNEEGVKTKQQQREERKGDRGYIVVGEKRVVTV